MTTHGDKGKIVRHSEFLAFAIIRRNSQKKNERTVNSCHMDSVVRRGAGGEVEHGKERK